MCLESFSPDMVHFHEMVNNGTQVQMPLFSQNLRHPKMHYMMAHVADGVESYQRLGVPGIVITPLFVALQPAFTTTDCANASLVGANLPAQFVPFRSAHALAEALVPASLGDQVHSQLETPVLHR